MDSLNPGLLITVFIIFVVFIWKYFIKGDSLYPPLIEEMKEKKYQKLLRKLEKGKGDVDVLDEYGNTLLHMVALSESNTPKIPLARLLINRGLVIDYPNKEGMTALSCAASMGPVDLVHLLIEHGADVNVVENNGDQPIHRAAYEGSPETVELLIEHGADVNYRGDKNKSPLDNAKHNKDSKAVIRVLKHHGAE